MCTTPQWYSLTDNHADGTCRVEFQKAPDRFWAPEVLRRYPFPPAGKTLSGRTVKLTGASGVWLYAHAAAMAAASGAVNLEVDTPHPDGRATDLTHCLSRLHLAGLQSARGALLEIHLRPGPALSTATLNQLVEPRLEELRKTQPPELTLFGRASVRIYAQAAWTAVRSGTQRILCWSARDGLVVVYDQNAPASVGTRIPHPEWLQQAMPKPNQPVVLGIVGDPNSGKSVLSTVFEWFLGRYALGNSWKLDCDGQSPTPNWYLSLLSQSEVQKVHDLEAEAQRLKEKGKTPWTPEMEKHIAQQLRRAKETFDILVADLPGGDHHSKPPRRIPSFERGEMFREVDAFVILQRADAPSEAAWREELAAYGLANRVVAVLNSVDPASAPRCEVSFDGQIWRGGFWGLKRTSDREVLGQAFGRDFHGLMAGLFQSRIRSEL